MSNTFEYIETDGMFGTWLLELRTNIKKNFLQEPLLKVLDAVIRKNEAKKPFTFVELTVHALVERLSAMYVKKSKRELLRFILLVMLGNDALPQTVDEPRYHNTKVLIGEGPLKDELFKELKEKFPGVECTYTVIPDNKGHKNYTNYAMIVYFGTFATKMRADLAHKKAQKAEKQKAKREAKALQSNSDGSCHASVDTESTDDASVTESVVDIELPIPDTEVSKTSGAGCCAPKSPVDPMTQRILDFADKKGKDLSAAVIAFVMQIAFAQKAKDGKEPNWENYGKLSTMISTLIGEQVADHPGWIPVEETQ